MDVVRECARRAPKTTRRARSPGAGPVKYKCTSGVQTRYQCDSTGLEFGGVFNPAKVVSLEVWWLPGARGCGHASHAVVYKYQNNTWYVCMIEYIAAYTLLHMRLYTMQRAFAEDADEALLIMVLNRTSSLATLLTASYEYLTAPEGVFLALEACMWCCGGNRLCGKTGR